MKGVAVQEIKNKKSEPLTKDLKDLLSKKRHFSLNRHKEISESIRNAQERQPNASELLSGVDFTPYSSGCVLFSAVLKKHRSLVLEELRARRIEHKEGLNITSLKKLLKEHEADPAGKSFKPVIGTSSDWDIEEEEERRR